MTSDDVFAWVSAASVVARIAAVVVVGLLLAGCGASWGALAGYAFGCLLGGLLFRWS